MTHTHLFLSSTSWTRVSLEKSGQLALVLVPSPLPEPVLPPVWPSVLPSPVVFCTVLLLFVFRSSVRPILLKISVSEIVVVTFSPPSSMLPS